jgi:hypothetical protein
LRAVERLLLLQSCKLFFRTRITRAWLDPEHHSDLIMRVFHPLDQRADHLPFPAPIGVCQPLLNLRGNVFQPPNNQAQVGVQRVCLGQVLALRFHRGDPLAESGEPGLELVRVNQRLGVTVEQPRQPLPQRAQLRCERREGRARCRTVGMHAPLVFRRQPPGVCPQRAHFRPHRQLQQSRPYLGILTDPFPPNAVRISAQAPVLGLCPGGARAGTGAEALSIGGIAALVALHQALEHIQRSSTRLPRLALIVPHLLLNRRQDLRRHERRHRNRDPLRLWHIRRGYGAPGPQRPPPLGPQPWPQGFLRRLPTRGAPHIGGLLQQPPDHPPIPDGLATARDVARPREAAADLADGPARPTQSNTWRTTRASSGTAS